MRIVNVILAAGAGTRMMSDLPKVLHPILGKPMVVWAIDMAEAVGNETPVVVVGHEQEQVRDALGARARFVEQAEQLGTGHAVMQAKSTLIDQADIVVVTYADMPLLRSDTVRRLVDQFVAAQREPDPPAMAILSITRDDPQGFGRVVRDNTGRVLASSRKWIALLMSAVSVS